jgi:hypothetical protein
VSEVAVVVLEKPSRGSEQNKQDAESKHPSGKYETHHKHEDGETNC